MEDKRIAFNIIIDIIKERCLQYEWGERLLEFFDKTDFWIAPASTKFHGSFTGGLAYHSYITYEKLCILLKTFVPAEIDDIIIDLSFKLAMCHDLCKVNVYKTEMRNTKNEKGEWIKVPYYTFQDDFPYGHGEKSVLIAEELGIPLTRREKMAIRWHMGAFDKSFSGDIFKKYPLAMWLHIADLIASNSGDENEMA